MRRTGIGIPAELAAVQTYQSLARQLNIAVQLLVHSRGFLEKGFFDEGLGLLKVAERVLRLELTIQRATPGHLNGYGHRHSDDRLEVDDSL